MDLYYAKVREHLLDLNISIVRELPEENIMVVDNEEAGIKNLILICTDPILIMEQQLFEIKKSNAEGIFEKLLKKNREIVHGAFALDNSGKNVIFRDTLQLENLDLNELDGSLKSLEFLMSEYSEEILEFSKN